MSFISHLQDQWGYIYARDGQQPQHPSKIRGLEFRQRYHNGEVSSNSWYHDIGYLGIDVIDLRSDTSIGHTVLLSREYVCELFIRFVSLIWSGSGCYNIRLRTISGNSTHPEAVATTSHSTGPHCLRDMEYLFRDYLCRSGCLGGVVIWSECVPGCITGKPGPLPRCVPGKGSAVYSLFP